MRIWQGRRILGKWLWIARSRRNRHTTTESARLLFSKLLPDHVRDGEHERVTTPEEALCGTSSFWSLSFADIFINCYVPIRSMRIGSPGARRTPCYACPD